MLRFLARVFLAAFTVFLAATAAAAANRPAPPRDLARLRWPAGWIADPTASTDGYGVYHFRRAFELPSVPASYVVHVSADNRYLLFVNGVAVAQGPARGDRLHWRYETIDLAPHLRPGRNVIAAQVWNAAAGKPWAQMSLRTGFLLQGATAAEDEVNTSAKWRVFTNPAFSPVPLDRKAIRAFYSAGDGDRVDGTLYPWGWEQPGFDDTAWHAAVKVSDAEPHGAGTGVNWWLVPANLPAMEATPQRLHAVRHAENVTVGRGFLAGSEPILVPPHTRATVLLDQSFETNAYPLLTVSGGRGSELKVVYSEALFDQEGRKGNRNDVEGRTCIGKSDVFLPDGGGKRRFSTLWFRTYRYIELTITTADDALTIDDFSGVFTGYPFRPQGQFASNDATLQEIWNVGWRTARLCAHETYFDCPYYEQLQYIGDTRIQALISLYVAGDDRLVRNAIELFDESRIAEGLTQSRYPSATPQFIDTFSLFWVDMVHDYWMHRDDPAFVRARLAGIRNVLEWFEGHVDANTGLLGPLPYWNFVDWTKEWPWTAATGAGGVPPGAMNGGSAIITLQFAYTLRHAADLFRAFGDPAAAARYAQLAANLNRRTVELCWDSQRQLLADTPAKTEFSQHANALAVLSGAVSDSRARELIERTAASTDIAQCTLYFRFYLLRAMKHVGLGDRYLDELQPWRDMLARGLTTFAEKADPTRSDCHAWSASPCYEFLATVCGIEPAAPGFGRVRVEPHLGALTEASGAVPTPKGEVRAEYHRQGNAIEAVITLPAGVEGDFVWAGQTVPLHAGRQTLRR